MKGARGAAINDAPPLGDFVAKLRDDDEARVKEQLERIAWDIEQKRQLRAAVLQGQAARISETADETIARHLKHRRDDSLKFARRSLTGKKRKSDAAKHSSAGSLLVYIQERWRETGRPISGVKIAAEQLSKRLSSTNMGASLRSVRIAVATCVAAGVLTTRKAGRSARYYVPTAPSSNGEDES
jgi:hypothetical protein